MFFTQWALEDELTLGPLAGEHGAIQRRPEEVNYVVGHTSQRTSHHAV